MPMMPIILRFGSVIILFMQSILGSRSRKQVFVTAKKSAAPPITSENLSESVATTSSSPATIEDERDILEEDLNDLNYQPYPKTGSGRGKRGRPPKPH